MSDIAQFEFHTRKEAELLIVKAGAAPQVIKASIIVKSSVTGRSFQNCPNLGRPAGPYDVKVLARKVHLAQSTPQVFAINFFVMACARNIFPPEKGN